MLYDFIFLLILFALIYSYMSSQSQFAATASAIRQIWSGSCRLSCRHSEHSSLSGLSGLPGPNYTLGPNPMKAGHALAQSQGPPGGSLPGPSRDCNCESCPCALIENFLRTCRPATNIYAELIQCTSNCVTYFLQMVEDAYEYIMRVFECNASCQRQAQLISTREYTDSAENFSFGRGDKQNPIDKVKSAIRDKSQISQSPQQDSRTLDGDAVPIRNDVAEPIIQDASGNKKISTAKDAVSRKASLPEAKQQEGTSKDTSALEEKVNNLKNIKVPAKPDPAQIPNSSEESVVEKGYCSKCIEKGRTCLKECPRAADRKADKK